MRTRVKRPDHLVGKDKNDAAPERNIRPLVLIAETGLSLAQRYTALLDGAGYDHAIVGTGSALLDRLTDESHPVSAVILDLNLRDAGGLNLLEDHPFITKRWPVIVTTTDGSISQAIEAMRLGAVDFLVKPFALPRVLSIVRSALAAARAAPERVNPPMPPAADGFMGFIGLSPPMLHVYRQIESVARSRATVFIKGESGTGKEVCAEAIHQAGPRADKPFIALNCGALPGDILESELFGHMKGSFTGAIADRTGAVRAADGGTLFLDEICEMELKLQVKLLRFLQTGTVQRVGSHRPEKVDVRIICATNRDPEAEVAAGRFRADLYYRLVVVPIELPPLRARGHDLAILANHFLRRFGKEEGKSFHRITPDLARAMAQHDWPGNVRELQNWVRRAAVMHDGPDLPWDSELLGSGTQGQGGTAPLALVAPSIPSPHLSPLALLASSAAPIADLPDQLAGLTLDAVERIAIEAAINRADGSLPAAARALGLSPSTLYRKRERWQDVAHGQRR